MKSRGKLILFADADGASKFSDFERLEKIVKKNCSSFEVSFCFILKLIFLNYKIKDDRIVVCGSRRHLEKDSIAKVKE